MKKTAVLLSLLIFGAACSEEAPPSAPASPTAPTVESEESKLTDPTETGNLLNLAGGASIVSRTAELTLESSAVLAIDGDRTTGWSTPPGDTNQTIVISLPAPARIERLGIRTPRGDGLRINNLTVRSSVDGKTFTTLAEPALAASGDTQMFDAAVNRAQYLEVTVTGAAGHIASLLSLQAHGTLLSPGRPGNLTGCYSINGEPSVFRRADGAIVGRSRTERPIYFEGGVEGSLYRFAWISGPDRGYGAIAVAPDGKSLSGLRWYVRPRPKNFGGSWFGEPGPCPAGDARTPLAPHFFRHNESFPLYSLHFDEQDQLMEAESAHGIRTLTEILRRNASGNVQIVSRELRETTPDANLKRAKARLDSLRAVLERRGGISRVTFTPTTEPPTEDSLRSDLIRAMNSTVEISIK